MSVYLRLKFVLIDDILTTFILVHFIMEVLKKKKIPLKSLHPHKKVNGMKYDTWSTLVHGVMVESQMRHARSFDSMIKKYEKEAALGKSDVLNIYTCKVVIDHGSLENTPVRTFGSYAKKFSPQPKKEKKMLRDLFFLLRNSSDPEKLSCISKCDDSRLSIVGDTYSELSNDSFSSKHSEVEDCFCTQGKTEPGCHGHRHLKKTSSEKEKSDLNDSTVTSGAISTLQNRKTAANKSDSNCNTVLSNGARLTRQNFKALQQKETASENNDLKYSTLTNGTRLTRQSFKAKQQKKTSAKEDVSTSEGITQDKDEKSKSNEISSAHSLCRNKSPVVLIRRLAPLMLKNLQKDGLTVTPSVSRIVQRTLRRSKRISKQNSISKYRSQKIIDPQNFISFETMIANVDTSLDIYNVSKNRIAVTGATASDKQHSESNTFVLHEESSASWKSAKIFTDSTEKTHNLTGVKKSPENDSCTITKQDIIPVMDTDAAESESAADTVSKQGITFVVDSDTAESVYFQHKKSIENHTVGIEPKTVLSPGESDVNYTKMNKTFTFAERKSVDNSKKISQDKQILPVSQSSRVCIKRDNESSTKSCQSECTNVADKELRYSNDTNAKENIFVSANMSVNEKYANSSLCTGLDKMSLSETTTLLEDPNNSCDYDIYDITTRLKSLNNLDENLSVSNIKFSMCSDLQFINEPVAMSTPVCKYNNTPSSTMSRGRNKGFFQSILVKEHNIVSKCKNLEISVEEENFTPGHSKLKNEVCCPELSREKSPSICKHRSTSDDEINFITFCDNIDSREKNSNCSVSSEDNAFLTNTCSAVPNQIGRQGDSACKYKSSISRSDLGIFCDMTSNISVKHNKKRSVVNNDKRPNLAKVESQHEHLWNTTKVNYLNTTQIKEVKSVTVCSNIKENDSNISPTELSKSTSCNYHSTEDDEINFIPLCDSAHLPETNDDHFLSPRGNTVLTGCRVTSYIEKNNTPVSPSKIHLSECNISRTELGGLFDIAKESPARHRKRTFVHNNNNCSIVSQPVSMVLPKKRDPKILGVPHVYSGDFPCKNPNITAQLDNSNHVLFDEPVNCDDDDECRKSTESIKRRPLCTAKYHVLEGTPNFIKSCDRMDDTETNGDHSLLSVGNNTELSSYNVTPSKIRKKDDLVCAHVLQKSISKSSLGVHHDIANSAGAVSGICSSRTISQKHDSKTISSQSVDANGSYCSNTNVTLQMDVVNSVLVDELGSSASKLPHCRNAWHSKSNTIHSDSAKVNSAHTHKYVSTLGDEINFIPILDNSDAAERNHPSMPLSGGNLDLAVMPGKGNDSVFQCKDTPVLKENNSEVSLHATCESPIKSRKKTSINDELVGHKSNLSNIKLNLAMSSSKLGLHKHKIPSEKHDVKHLTSQHMKVRKCLMYNTNTSTTQTEEINFIQIHEPLNSNFKQKLIHPIKDHGGKQSVLSFENHTKDTIHKRCSKTLTQSVSPKSYKLPSGTKVHKSEIWSKRDVNEGAASERHFCHNKLHGTETDEINFISLC